MSHLPHFITPILKSLMVPVIWLALIGAIYSRIALFSALNHILFLANEEATLKIKQGIRFPGFFKVTNQIAGKWKTKSIMWRVLQLLFVIFSAPKINEFNFKLAQYCIDKIFELTKSCIWAISNGCKTVVIDLGYLESIKFNHNWMSYLNDHINV